MSKTFDRRVRYESYGKGLVSKRSFKSKTLMATSKPTLPKTFVVYLHPLEKRYEVVETIDDVVEASGTHTSLQELKKSAKKALLKLGVPLQKERRKRTAKDKHNLFIASLEKLPEVE